MGAKTIYPSAVDQMLLSTHGNSEMARASFMQDVDHQFKTKLDLTKDSDSRFNKPWVDPLDPELMSRLRFKESDMLDYAYDGVTPITNISYNLYGTTTLWYVIVYVNGLLNPLEIPGGTVLKVPKKDVLAEKFRKKTAQESRVGSVVVI